MSQLASQLTRHSYYHNIMDRWSQNNQQPTHNNPGQLLISYSHSIPSASINFWFDWFVAWFAIRSFRSFRSIDRLLPSNKIVSGRQARSAYWLYNTLLYFTILLYCTIVDYYRVASRMASYGSGCFPRYCIVPCISIRVRVHD